MNDHKIIDTDQLKKGKFSFSGLSEKTKNQLIAGGLSFAGIAAVVGLSRIFISEDTFQINSGLTSPDSNIDITANSNDVEKSTTGFENEDNIVENKLENVSENEVLDDIDINGDNTYEEIEYIEAEYTITFDSDAAFAQNINDIMDFSEAFANARADVGLGGFFNWRENSYSTYTEEEWNSMSPEDKELFLADVSEKSNLDTNTWSVATQEPYNDSIEDGHPNFSNQNSNEELELIDESDLNLENDADMPTNIEINTDVQTITIVPPTVYGSADINSDNIVDAIVVDNNNDGKADLLALDEDYDGIFESFRINEDGDDDLDVFIIDEGGDGIDDTDTIDEISDIVDMNDFIIIDADDESLEGLDFIDELIDVDQDDELQDDSSSIDTNFDDPGL